MFKFNSLLNFYVFAVIHVCILYNGTILGYEVYFKWVTRKGVTRKGVTREGLRVRGYT